MPDKKFKVMVIKILELKSRKSLHLQQRENTKEPIRDEEFNN